jgi:pyrroloquinoline quinone biosynthesis protein B
MSPVEPIQPRLRALVLGSAAGGGVPQWNCGCRVCQLAWSGDGRVKPRSQASLALSVDGASWVLLNASIDLRQQILATPALKPKGEGRHSPVGAVVLTNAEVDAAAGLLALRERQPLAIFATQSTLDAIGANRMFDVVDRGVAPRRTVRLGEKFEPLPGIKLELFAVPGKVPLWLEEGSVSLDDVGEGTVCVAAEAGGRKLVYAPGCAHVTEDLDARIGKTDVLFFDGTLFADDEMIANGLGDKTGRRMGHMPVAGPGGTLEAFARHAHVRRVLIHINNSNPILIEGSPEEAKVKAAGWEVAFDGMEVAL